MYLYNWNVIHPVLTTHGCDILQLDKAQEKLQPPESPAMNILVSNSICSFYFHKL